MIGGMTSDRRNLLTVGEAAPWFRAAAFGGRADYAFDLAGGRAVLMCFFGTTRHLPAQAALDELQRRRELFDDRSACFYGVTVDPGDSEQGRIVPQLPGIRFFLDHDRAVSRLYGAARADDPSYAGHWLLLDASLRVAGVFPLGDASAALDACARLALQPFEGDWAPVLQVPDILEPDLCRRLIDFYEERGGEQSGFMRDVGGMTRLLLDPAHKVRSDRTVDDPGLMKALHLRVFHRLKPMIMRAFQFDPTRIERLLVGCYDAETGGHFRTHRDNTSRGTAHRRFAVTINLNADEYEGGELVFPEYGSRRYKPPTGGAVVFSCSLLHQAMPVTRGRRYAFLPFLYDEEGAKLREQNAHFLEGDLAKYEANAAKAG